MWERNPLNEYLVRAGTFSKNPRKTGGFFVYRGNSICVPYEGLLKKFGKNDLAYPAGINNKGQVLMLAQMGRKVRTFLLTPDGVGGAAEIRYLTSSTSWSHYEAEVSYFPISLFRFSGGLRRLFMWFSSRLFVLFACTVAPFIAEKGYAEAIEFNTSCRLRYATGGLASGGEPTGLIRDYRIKCKGVKSLNQNGVGADCEEEDLRFTNPLPEWGANHDQFWVTPSELPNLNNAQTPLPGRIIALRFTDITGPELTPFCYRNQLNKSINCPIEIADLFFVDIFYRPKGEASTVTSNSVGETYEHFLSENVELSLSSPVVTRSIEHHVSHVLNDSAHPLGISPVVIKSRLDCTLSYKLLR
jgi:hypothetical protein